MKRLVNLLAVILLLLPVSTTFADDDNPPAVQADESIVIVRQREVTNETSVKIRGGRDEIDASTTRTVGSVTIKYSNAAAQGWDCCGGTYVRHSYARTARIAGTASYQAEAHAALLDGTTLESPSVFDFITDPCAQSIINNATAQSCSSPWFQSSPGRGWYIVSGHYFDIWINGTRDSTCDGCIDWVYWTQ